MELTRQLMIEEQHGPDSLSAALHRSQIVLPGDQISLLDAYCRQLWDWNSKLNLTRHTDYEKFVTRDVADCLKLVEALNSGERVLDVGSGGGVPGIVLAILRPDLHVSLVESVAKRARVLDEITRTLRLPVAVHHARAEALMPDLTFDTLTIRAVAPLIKLLRWFHESWNAFDRMLVIKGPAWTEERLAAREAGLMRSISLRKIAAWPVPGADGESVLLELRPKSQFE